MKYRPDLHFVYPEQVDGHMIAPELVFDVKILSPEYPYYDRSFFFVFKQNLMHLLFLIFIVPVACVRFGLCIKGRNVFRKYHKLLKKGAITVCNHVYEWDYLCVRAAIYPRKQYFTIWKNNLLRSLGPAFRTAGAVPIPSGNLAAIRSFERDVLKLLDEGRWLHFYPEGSMWYYEDKLRPFKKGVFSFAYRANKPVIPLAISYRPAKGIYRLFKGKYPLCTISIGEPLFPDYSLPKEEAVEKLRSEAEAAVAKQIDHYTAQVNEKEQNHEQKA